MDLNYILVWFVGIGCLGALWNGLRARSRFGLGRAMYAAIVLALTLAVYYTRPDIGGFIGLALFAFLIILPGWGLDWMWRAAHTGRYTRARLIRLWLRFMHPFLDWRQITRQMQIEEYAQTGRLVQAQQLLQAEAGGQTAEGVIAAVRIYQVNGDWRGANKWIDANMDPALYQRHHELVSLKLRALGEEGKLDEMVAFFSRHQGIYQEQPEELGKALLIMMAFSGRPQTVSHLLQQKPPGLTSPIQGLWLATAYLAAGDEAKGRELLLALPASHDVILQQSIHRRLHRGVVVAANTLSLPAQEALDQLATWAEQKKPVPSRVMSAPTRSRPVVTYLLIGLNVIVFFVELSQGGSQNALTLYLLGALNPQAILNGEWWRLFTSMFLHAGLLHLLLNMYILYRVGGFMEYALGSVRYIILYLLAGLGSGLLMVILALLGLESMDLLAVGASGAIMGLIGAEAALWIKVYRQTGEQQALQRLRSLGLFVVIQTAFDLSTPQISFPAHFGGLLTGFLLGAFLQTGRTVPWASKQINPPEPEPTQRSV